MNRLHRDILAPVGFERRGSRCTRVDNGLVREIRFYTDRWGDPATKGIRVHLEVRIADLPEPLVPHRRDTLWTGLEPEYPRPPTGDPLPVELVHDVAGPALDFLCRAADLPAFVTWATEVHAGEHSWKGFRHVYPFGTGPLQAAALAAAVAGDRPLAERISRTVADEEDDPREMRDFRTELRRLVPA